MTTRSLTALLAMLLRSQGFEVITANNGPDGIEATKLKSPDIVILDLLMPEVDGWAVCQSLRTFTDIPIIVLSAIDNPGSVGSALDAGADDYLIKPVPNGVLIAHINNLTRRAIAQRELTPHRQADGLAHCTKHLGPGGLGGAKGFCGGVRFALRRAHPHIFSGSDAVSPSRTSSGQVVNTADQTLWRPGNGE